MTSFSVDEIISLTLPEEFREVQYKQLSKFQVVKDHQLISPGKCTGCGKISGDFVDIGLELDFYGVVYFCVSCIVEIANQLEYYSPAQQKIIRDSNIKLREINAKLREKLEKSNAALAAFAELSRDRNPVASDPVSTDYPERQIITEALIADVPSIGAEPEGEDELTQFINEQGLGVVQRDDSLDTFLGDNI